MGLKIKILPDFITSQGYKDTNTVFSIREVSFRNYSGEIAIEWEITPSSWVEGVDKQRFVQTIPFDYTNASFVQLLLTNSDLIHELSMETPFIPSINGLKSFNDFNAITKEV